MIFRLKSIYQGLKKIKVWNVAVCNVMVRGRSRAAATSKIECFLTIITEHSILDVEVALDPPLMV